MTRHKWDIRLLSVLQILSTAYLAGAHDHSRFYREFIGTNGTAVVLDRKSGDVIALHNPALAERLSLAPGSTLKPLTLAVLLNAGKLSAGETFRCPGTLSIAGHNLTCAHPHAPEAMNVERALAYSCNNFVAHFAVRFPDGELARALRSFGLSSAQAAVGENAKALQALGEDAISATPLEMARAYRKLASLAPPEVFAGLRGAVEYGTARLAAVEGLPVWGKTGTVGHHGWFAGFTESQVVVVVVQGQGGGSDAAPIARRIFEALNPPGPGILTVRLNSTARRLPLEDYVASVLAGECKDFRSSEALKAMAVVARTFAVRFRGRHKQEGFDFCDNTHCQNLRHGSVTQRERDAAAATVGELVWFRGAPAATYYSKDCGGETESASAVWPDMAAQYLLHSTDHFCPRKPWSSSLSASDFTWALRANGLDSPREVRAVDIAARSESGRALRLRILGDDRATTLSASTVRFALGRTLGWSTLRSDLYDVHMQGGRILFHGFGTGHGVGLCQLGADAAGSAKNYREIIAIYYLGATSGLTAQGLHWQHLGGERVDIFSTQPSKDASLVNRGDALLKRAEEQTGFHLDRRPLIRIYPTVSTFRDSTGEPGWVAGDTQGRLIRLQPNPPGQTIYHELLHVLVESKADALLPVWFREELVQYLAGDSDRATDMPRLIARYGRLTVIGWVTRGLPPELTNNKASQAVTHAK